MHNRNDATGRSDAPGALARFYAERFRSDPWALLDYFDGDIAAAAADVGLRWDAVRNSVELKGDSGTKIRPKGTGYYTDKAHRGKLMVWGAIKRDNKDGFDTPFLTFNNNNPSIGTSTWSGFSALLELYRREGNSITSEKHDRWLAQQEERRLKREAEREAAEQRARESEERVQRERLAYETVWLCGGRQEFEYESNGKIRQGFVELVGDEDGTAPYLVKKQIGDVMSRFKAKRLRDCHGEFTAIPMYTIEGKFGGLQRLYAEFKLQGTGVKMEGLHCIIGDLETAERKYFSEGFATGASIYLAEQEAGKEVAVVVCFNVDNLLKVARLYRKFYTAWRFHNAADNDAWKDANAGLLAGLEIHRDLEHTAVVPSFEALGEEAIAGFKATRKGPTDWNDYHVEFGLEATAKALRARDNVMRAEKDWFSYSLQRLELSGTQHQSEKAALTAVTAGMMLVPIKHTSAEVLRQVLACLPASSSASRFKIRSRVLWLAKQKMADAQRLRGFSAGALARPNIQHLRIEGVRASHGGYILPGHLADLVESLEGIVIVRAPMGAGKTEKLIAPLMQAAPKAAYIAHRISLLDDAAARLDIQHYQNVSAAMMPGIYHLACCVNSLTHPKFYNSHETSWFTTVDTLCIDEASQVVRHVTTGPVEGRVKVLDALLEAVAAAKRVLLCDADANDTVIEFCEMARPGQQITILEVTGANDHIRVDHTDDESAWQMAVDLIAAGKRVLVANDSAESGKKMAALIEAAVDEEKIKPVKMLLVHADSKADPDVTAFLCNPNEEAVKYDVLIYSPAISSGVSMTTPHFDHHIGLFSGNSVGPSDAIQMLRRDRTSRHYVVGIGHSTGLRPTDPETLWRGFLASDEIACEFEETSDEILLRRKKSAFDHLFLSSVTTENAAKNNFANNLLLMLYADGYQVNRLTVDSDLAKASRSNRKFAGEIVFDRRCELIDSVETPNEEEFTRLNRQEVRSERESAQVDRYHIAHQLGVDEPTPIDIAFYDDRGVGKVHAMELLQAEEQQARDYDKAQRKARVVLSQQRYKTAARAMLVKIFEILGVDRFTGEGEFGGAEMRQVHAMITESQKTQDLYASLKIGGGVGRCYTTLVKSILARLGANVCKRKTNGRHLFAITPDSWGIIMDYVERRKALGVHSLTTHETEAAHQPKPAPEQPEQPQKALQAAPVALSSDRDTLQCEGVDTDEKYPLGLAEKVFAIAARCSRPLGLPLARVIGALRRETVMSWLAPGADEWRIGFELGYAADLMKKSSV